MNIAKAALIAEIVGGIGVVVSLVFVGLEIRSGSASEQARALLDLRLAIGEPQRSIASSPELGDLMQRGYLGYGDLDAAERYRFNLLAGNVLATYRTAFEYGSLGLVSQEELSAWRFGVCSYLGFPGVRRVWRERWRGRYAGFTEWVEADCAVAAEDP